MNKHTILKRSKQVCLFSLGVPFTLSCGLVFGIISYVPFVCHLFYSGFVLNKNPFKEILGDIPDTEKYNKKNKLLHHFYTIFSPFIALLITPIVFFITTYSLYDKIRSDTLLETIRDNLPSFRKNKSSENHFSPDDGEYDDGEYDYGELLKTLDFKEEENPSHTEIKKKYRTLIFQYHPDKYPKGISEKEKTENEEKFRRINTAYSSFFAAHTTFEEEEEEEAAASSSRNYCSVD